MRAGTHTGIVVEFALFLCQDKNRSFWDGFCVTRPHTCPWVPAGVVIPGRRCRRLGGKKEGETVAINEPR